MAGVKSKKKMKWIIIILAVLLVVGVIAVVGIGMAMSKLLGGAMLPVSVASATTGELQETVTANGTIQSEKTLAVLSQVNANVDQILVQVGEEVKAGECIISFDKESAEEAMEQATLQQTKSNASYQKMISSNSDNSYKLNEANVNLDVLKQQISDWETNIKNMQDQLEKSMRDTSNGYASQIFNLTQKIETLQKEMATLDPASAEYERKQKELEELNKQLAQVQYQQQLSGNTGAYDDLKKKIEKAQEELAGFKEYEAEMKGQKTASENSVLDQYDRAQLEADNTLSDIAFRKAQEEYQKVCSGITADFDGIITACTVISGMPVVSGTQVATLESSKDVKVVLQVPQGNLEKIAIGQTAEIKVNSLKYDGKISKISRMAVSSGVGNSTSIQVEVHIENPDENIVLNMDSKVEIFTRKVEGAVLVPVEAVNVDNEGEFVYVVKDDQTVEKRYVTIGITADMQTEIVEGVKTGEQVITESMFDITEGMKVATTPMEGLQ